MSMGEKGTLGITALANLLRKIKEFKDGVADLNQQQHMESDLSSCIINSHFLLRLTEKLNHGAARTTKTRSERLVSKSEVFFFSLAHFTNLTHT